MADQFKDPWADTANQAVGALYKYYLSQPSAADAAKAQYQQAQIERLNVQNKMDNGQMALGNFAYPNLSPEIRNMEYLKSLEAKGDTNAAKLFGTYVNKPMQVDAGDAKYIVDGSSGLPMQEYGVGVAPKVEFDKENNRFVPMPAIPATNRPPMQIADAMLPYLVNQESGGDPMALSPKGAGGLTQIMPDTARDPGYGVTPLQGWDGKDPRTAPPEEQLRFGRDYLAAQVRENGGDPAKAAAAYNGGPGRLADAVQTGGDQWLNQMPAETQDYVPRVAGPVMDTASRLARGEIVDLPKNPADVERENDMTFSQGRQLDGLNQTIASAMYNIAEGGAGFGAYAKDIPFVGGQTTAATLEADLSKITNKAALDEIARLKEESKTGGFFGNLSDGERQAVADSQLAIRQTMNPQELAYRLMMHQDLVNDIVHGRGKPIPGTDQIVPMDAGAPRSGLPTITDVQNAQSIDELMAMWDAFDKMAVFKGAPPEFIEKALVERVNMMRGAGQ